MPLLEFFDLASLSSSDDKKSLKLFESYNLSSLGEEGLKLRLALEFPDF